MWTALVVLFINLSAAPDARIAARVNGEAILVREIDAPSSTKIARLHEQLVALSERAIDDLVDECLRTLAPAAQGSPPFVAPITDEEIRAIRTSRAEDFAAPIAPEGATRNPEVARAAIQHYLHQKALEATEADRRRRRREGHVVELSLPQAGELEHALPSEREVARVDGVAIRAAAFEQAAALPLYRLRGEMYRERQRNLEAAIEERLLTQEAHRRGVSMQTLLAEVSAAATVSPQELEAFLEAERAAGRAVPRPERARPYLEFRKAHVHRTALLARLRGAACIEVLLQEPAAPRLPMLEADAPVLGPQAGPRLVVYTNYRCTPCRAVHREIDRLRAIDPTVRVIFRDFIPVYDPVASEAARLTRCAAQLGAFERMRSALLRRQPPIFGLAWYTEDTLPALSRTLGVDPAVFMPCLSATETRQAIERDTAHAHALGFEEAPALIAESLPVSGTQSAGGLARALRHELRPPAFRQSSSCLP
jgi:protein-disulfide isomerase